MSAKRMTIRELSEYSGLSSYAISLMVKQGAVPYLKVGNRVFLDPVSFDEALQQIEKENQSAAKKNFEQTEKPKEIVHYGKLKDLIN